MREKELLTQYQILWHQVFGDDWGFIHDLFQAVEASKIVPLLRHEVGILKGALLIVPYDIKMEDDSRAKAGYVYGVLTNPPYRNQGICTQLLHMAEIKAKEMGMDYLFLSPASAELEQFYAGRGYSKLITEKLTIPIGETTRMEYNESLPLPCLQHSSDIWPLAAKYFGDGEGMECQFLSLNGKEMPQRLITAAVFR